VGANKNNQCGRCSVYKGDSRVNEVHHVVHLSQGGANSLDNLVGLCGDCHALMHPTVDVIKGNEVQADVFPDEYATDSVSVVRRPHGNDDLEYDVERLSEFSKPDVNTNAVTKASVPTSAKIARQAGTSLRQILLNQGYVPRTSSYHRVSVRPKPVNLLAAISTRGIELTTRSDGTALEVEEVDDGPNALDVYFSADTNNSEFDIQEPSGDMSTNELALNHTSGSRLRLEKPVRGPDLTAATLPEYAVGGAKYFGWQSLKLGVIPGVILAFLFPPLIPAGGSLFGFIAFVLIIGLLIRTPAIYEDATGTTTERVIDERNE